MTPGFYKMFGDDFQELAPRKKFKKISGNLEEPRKYKRIK